MSARSTPHGLATGRRYISVSSELVGKRGARGAYSCDTVNVIRSERGAHYGTCEDEKTCRDASSFAKATADEKTAARKGGDKAAGEEWRVEGQRLIPVAERQFVQGPEMR